MLMRKYPQEGSLPLPMPTVAEFRIFRVTPTVISGIRLLKGLRTHKSRHLLSAFPKTSAWPSRQLPGAALLLRAIADAPTDLLRDPVLPAETVIFELAVFVLDAVQLASRALGDAQTGMPLSANWVAGSREALLKQGRILCRPRWLGRLTLRCDAARTLPGKWGNRRVGGRLR